MSKYIFFLVLFLFACRTNAQVTNVTWALSPNQDKITILYDLAPERFFDVYIEALLDGKTLKPVKTPYRLATRPYCVKP